MRPCIGAGEHHTPERTDLAAKAIRVLHWERNYPSGPSFPLSSLCREWAEVEEMRPEKCTVSKIRGAPRNSSDGGSVICVPVFFLKKCFHRFSDFVTTVGHHARALISRCALILNYFYS